MLMYAELVHIRLDLYLPFILIAAGLLCAADWEGNVHVFVWVGGNIRKNNELNYICCCLFLFFAAQPWNPQVLCASSYMLINGILNCLLMTTSFSFMFLILVPIRIIFYWIVAIESHVGSSIAIICFLMWLPDAWWLWKKLLAMRAEPIEEKIEYNHQHTLLKFLTIPTKDTTTDTEELINVTNSNTNTEPIGVTHKETNTKVHVSHRGSNTMKMNVKHKKTSTECVSNDAECNTSVQTTEQAVNTDIDSDTINEMLQVISSRGIGWLKSVRQFLVYRKQDLAAYRFLENRLQKHHLIYPPNPPNFDDPADKIALLEAFDSVVTSNIKSATAEQDSSEYTPFHRDSTSADSLENAHSDSDPESNDSYPFRAHNYDATAEAIAQSSSAETSSSTASRTNYEVFVKGQHMVLFDLEDNENENTIARVADFLATHLHLPNVAVFSAHRLGPKSTQPRPINFIVTSETCAGILANMMYSPNLIMREVDLRNIHAVRLAKARREGNRVECLWLEEN